MVMPRTATGQPKRDPTLLCGVVPPMVTPFTADGELDHRSLRALCRYLIDAGVHALYPCGTTGEFVLLSDGERRAVAETVVEEVQGRIPVFVHVGAAGTRETVALAHHAASIGASGVAAVAPYFYAYTDDDLRRHYLALAEAVAPLPVYLYNLPAHARNRLSVDLASELHGAAPNIVGIKDSSGDLAALSALCTQTGLSVLSGTDGLNLAALRAGCAGMVSGNAGAVPGPFVALWNAWIDSDDRAAQRAQAEIDAVCLILDHGARLADFKAVLVERGVLRSAAVRAPHPPARNGRSLQAALCSLGTARAAADPADGEAFRPRPITSR